MSEFAVTVRRSFETTETIEADTAEEAFEKVNRFDYPLPPIEEWHTVDDWMYWVFNEQGEEVLWVS